MTETKTHKAIIAILEEHCGERDDSEGAVETLTRIIRERDKASALFIRLPTLLQKYDEYFRSWDAHMERIRERVEALEKKTFK